jgi:DNA-binding MarR family transcriptional regulator
VKARSTGCPTSTNEFFSQTQNPRFDRNGSFVYIHFVTKELDLATMENCVCFNLRRVTRRVTQFFDAELRRHGIRPTQTPVLAALAAKSGWSMEDLSDWLGMERTTLVRNLRPLERDRLVEISGAGRGGRVSVSISARGRKGLAQAIPAWRAAQQAVVKTLGEKRWSGILCDLEKAAIALNE